VFSRRIIILDCGASRTALGVFHVRRGRLTLEQHGVESFDSVSSSPEKWLENTCTAFRTLRLTFETRGPVVLVLPAHLLLSRLVKLPPVSGQQRTKLIRFEAAQQIPAALADVVWGSVAAKNADHSPEELLVAAKHETVEALCLAATEAGFTPCAVLPAPLATLAAFRVAGPNRSERALVLNLGARSGTLLVVDPDRFGLRTFPLTGQGVEDATTGSPADQRVSRALQDITRCLAPLSQEVGEVPPASIYLTGGGTRLPGLAEAIGIKFKVPVHDLNVRGAIDTSAKQRAGEMSAGVMTDLVGAAAAQLFRNQATVNLLPLARRHRHDLARRKPWLVAAGLLVVAAFFPPLIHYHRLASEAREKTAAIERELGPWRARNARNRDSLQQLGQLKEQIARLQGILVRRASWADLLADWQDRLLRVDDVWFDQLQVSPGAPGLPWRLSVSGRMLDRGNPLARVSPENFGRVRALLASLTGSPFVTAVESERFDNTQPGILRFDFVLVTNPQRPL
jgi:type IV pilus assembly protein PilM